MGQDGIEARVGKLETEQARQGERLSRIEVDVGKAVAGIDRLIERDARRPQSLSWGQISAAVTTTLVIGGGLWWLGVAIVEHSPSVQALEQRMNYAEWKYGWASRVDRGQ